MSPTHTTATFCLYSDCFHNFVQLFNFKRIVNLIKSLYTMVDVKKFSEIDIYGLLEVEIAATEQEVS